MTERLRLAGGYRPLRFTREVLETIPIWVELGARPAEIAAALGTTTNSLYVKCSGLGISLTATGPALGRYMQVVEWATVQREADRRGVSVPQLMAQVIVTVAERNLFSSVLGDFTNGNKSPCAARS